MLVSKCTITVIGYQEKIEDNKVGNKELLMARRNKRYRKICKRLQFMEKDKELYRHISGETDGK